MKHSFIPSLAFALSIGLLGPLSITFANDAESIPESHLPPSSQPPAFPSSYPHFAAQPSSWKQTETIQQWHVQQQKRMQQQAETFRHQAYEHWKKHAPTWAIQPYTASPAPTDSPLP